MVDGGWWEEGGRGEGKAKGGKAGLGDGQGWKRGTLGDNRDGGRGGDGWRKVKRPADADTQPRSGPLHARLWIINVLVYELSVDC